MENNQMQQNNGENKKSKKKLIIAIVCLAIALLGVVGVTAGVLAAQSAAINSNIDVRYTAQEVAVRVSATYQVANGTETDMTDGNSNTTITIDGTETGNPATGTLSPSGQIDLTKTNNYVIFKYTIINDGSRALDASLMTLPSATNVTVTYSTDGSSYSSTNSGLSNLATNATGVYYVKVQITNIALDASFTGSFQWSLTAAA